MNTRHHYLSLLRTFALATLIAAAVTACTDDNGDPAGNEPITPTDGIPVAFTANINPGSSDANPAAAPGTRTVLTPDGNGGFTVTWKGKDSPDGSYDQVNIWAAQGNTLTNSWGKTYVPTTSGASSELVPKNDANKLTLSSSGEWKFTAAYGEYGLGDGMAFAALSYQSQSAPGDTKHIAENDFSIATATQHIEAGEMPNIINFKFEHKLSALQLHVTNQTGEELTIKEILLSAAGGEISMKKDYDVAQGKWNTTGEYKGDYLKLNASNFPALATGGASQDLHMLFFPGYENETLTVTVITSRGEYSRTKPAPDGGFIAGKNYLTDITIKSDGLTDKETWRETIRTAEQLAAFCDRVNNGTDNYQGKTVYLADNIDLANASWTPIGTDENKPFKGTFDGDGYKISNLNVNVGTQNVGLFGYVNGGKVCNLRVKGNVTTTEMYAGGIVGQLQNSTVENCIFDGTVSGNNMVGGIAGYSQINSRIAGCHTKGSVTVTSNYSGGIAGENEGSTITDCYSKAEVKGYAFTGGIAGKNETDGIITRCYATGQVSGEFLVGGIVGDQYNGTLTGCIALNPGLTRTGGYEVDFGRVGRSGTFTSCAAFDGMTLPNGVTVTSAADGKHGADLSAADCLTPAAYTSRGFTEATATTPGWVFDAASPWTYLPWNKVFDSWNISETEYRIQVPAHLSNSGGN